MGQAWARSWLDEVRRAASESAGIRRTVKRRKCRGGRTELLLDAERACDAKTEAACAVIDFIGGIVGRNKADAVECYYVDGFNWRQVAQQMSVSVGSVVNWRDDCVSALDEIGERRVAENTGYGLHGLP